MGEGIFWASLLYTQGYKLDKPSITPEVYSRLAKFNPGYILAGV